VGVKLGLFQ